MTIDVRVLMLLIPCYRRLVLIMVAVVMLVLAFVGLGMYYSCCLLTILISVILFFAASADLVIEFFDSTLSPKTPTCDPHVSRRAFHYIFIGCYKLVIHC